MLIPQSYIDDAQSLRSTLHNCPELAFSESKTRQVLSEFIQTEYDEKKPYILVCSKGTSPDAASYVFRADMDAVKAGDGNPGHYCGHDGHSAVLAAVYRYLTDHPHKHTVYCLFQPAEETGEGARTCLEAVQELHPDAVFGFHNIPGKKAGTILLRNGTFACASTGVEFRFHGKASHAAYPEQGANPAKAMANTLMYADYLASGHHDGMLMSTVIGMECGSDAYGLSASEGVLRLTLRGELQSEFEEYTAAVNRFAGGHDAAENLTVDVDYVEAFPATENRDKQVQDLMNLCIDNDLPFEWLQEPFRWSEDFGWYLHNLPGAYFGVGAGETCSGLHTAEYCFPDAIIEPAMRMFLLISGIEHERT